MKYDKENNEPMYIQDAIPKSREEIRSDILIGSNIEKSIIGKWSSRKAWLLTTTLVIIFLRGKKKGEWLFEKSWSKVMPFWSIWKNIQFDSAPKMILYIRNLKYAH